MTTIGDFMMSDHRRCDEMLERAVEAGAAGDCDAAATAFETFHAAITRHIAWEEDLLFPPFEAATGMSGAGPTQTMRVEHVQMRELFDQMKSALASRDVSRYRELCETLVGLLQQHNMKEEQMMYPMLDEVLGERAGELIDQCNAAAPTA